MFNPMEALVANRTLLEALDVIKSQSFGIRELSGGPHGRNRSPRMHMLGAAVELAGQSLDMLINTQGHVAHVQFALTVDEGHTGTYLYGNGGDTQLLEGVILLKDAPKYAKEMRKRG